MAHPKKVAVDLRSVFQAAQAYVMLSRVQSIEQLFIIGELPENKIYADEEAKNQLKIMVEKSVNKNPPIWERNIGRSVKVSCINICSLKDKIADVKVDLLLHHSDVIILGETWLTGSINNEGLSGDPVRGENPTYQGPWGDPVRGEINQNQGLSGDPVRGENYQNQGPSEEPVRGENNINQGPAVQGEIHTSDGPQQREHAAHADTSIQLHGFDLNLNSVGRGKGLAAYFKADKFTVVKSVTKDLLQLTVLASVDLCVIALHRSSGDQELRQNLIEVIPDDCSCLVIGDFNICSIRNSDHEVFEALQQMGFQLLTTQATHIEGGHIDQAWFKGVDPTLKSDVAIYSPYYTAKDHDAQLVTVYGAETEHGK